MRYPSSHMLNERHPGILSTANSTMHIPQEIGDRSTLLRSLQRNCCLAELCSMQKLQGFWEWDGLSMALPVAFLGTAVLALLDPFKAVLTKRAEKDILFSFSKLDAANAYRNYIQQTVLKKHLPREKCPSHSNLRLHVYYWAEFKRNMLSWTPKKCPSCKAL